MQVGNKTDLQEQREVSVQDGQDIGEAPQQAC